MARSAAASFSLMRRLLLVSAPPGLAPPFRSCSAGIEIDLTKDPREMISYLGDWYLTEQAMKHPGMDYRNWLWDLEKKIYKVVYDVENPGFGCEIDWDTADKLKELDNVRKVSPDYYPDPKYKDYGCESLVK